MSDKILTSVVAVITAIIGVAIVAVIVSKSSNTSGVLGAGGSAFSSILGTALKPVGGFSNNSSGLALGNLTSISL